MFVIIVNPIAGNGKTLRLLPEIESVLDTYRYTHITKITDYVSHAIDMAREAVSQNAQGVLVVGGDGTVAETLTGLQGSDVPMIYVPCGTGNDFVKCLHLPSDPIKALRIQLDHPGAGRRLDYGRANDRCFMNVAGTGFDVEVLKQTLKHKAKHQGLGAYLRGVRDAIKFFRPIECEVQIDDEPSFHGAYSIISVGNGQFIGGGMKAVPNAEPDDGLLDVVLVDAVKKWQVILLMPFFVLGKHTMLKITRTLRCEHIRIKSPDMTVQLDGEIMGMNDADIRVEQAGLNTCLP